MGRLLKKGTNSKLGKTIASLNLPAVETCPGRTKACERVCYATSGYYRYPSVKESLDEAREHTQAPDFVDQLSGELKRSRTIRAVRIHASGDFHSVSYIRKWVRIVRDNPDVQYWAYTRSWRVKRLQGVLRELAELPNIELFASTDNETIANREEPPSWMRRAHMTEDWTGAPDDHVRCPNLKDKSITCEKCTYCFKPAKGHKRHVVFRVH